MLTPSANCCPVAPVSLARSLPTWTALPSESRYHAQNQLSLTAKIMIASTTEMVTVPSIQFPSAPAEQRQPKT